MGDAEDEGLAKEVPETVERGEVEPLNFDEWLVRQMDITKRGEMSTEYAMKHAAGSHAIPVLHFSICPCEEDNGLGGLMQRNVDVPRAFFYSQLDQIYSIYVRTHGKHDRPSCQPL
jgi:hypothetical protein